MMGRIRDVYMYESSLQKLIIHAYNSVPYYRKLFDKNKIDAQSIITKKDLSVIPILNKNIVREQLDEMLSLHITKKIVKSRTSGSTGKFLTIYWDESDLLNSLRHLWAVRFKNYGIKPNDRYCTFHISISSDDGIEVPLANFDEKLNELSFSSTDIISNAGYFYEEMLKFKPTWIRGAPSILFVLADYIYSKRLPPIPSIKYIETSGEYLTEHYRKIIEYAFGVNVVNQYGCREANSIAIECKYKNLHCLSDNVLVEILKNGAPQADGEEGEIYLTCLTNRYMPFIRYSIGDIGYLDSKLVCPCGNKNPVLNLKCGRINEFAILPNGNKIFSGVFMYIVEKINEKYESLIKQFKVIQKDKEYFDVYFVVEKLPNNTLPIENLFIKEVAKVGFNNAKWFFFICQ
jgi:phenylacetate-CoA ligase